MNSKRSTRGSNDRQQGERAGIVMKVLLRLYVAGRWEKDYKLCQGECHGSKK